MIRPGRFEFNQETASDNHFQQKPDHISIYNLAVLEFDAMVEKIRSFGTEVIVFQDSPEPHTPDSVFPNNWCSLHHNGVVCIYPMLAKNRRLERNKEVLDAIRNAGFDIKELRNYSPFEDKGKILEGTGSMVLDHMKRKAYTSISNRTDKELTEWWCNDNGYTPIFFHAFQTKDHKRLPVYHTNVVLSIGQNVVIVCPDAIDDEEERQHLLMHLSESREVVFISETQMHSFAGNMLQVTNRRGELGMVMSDRAWNSLDLEQKQRIQNLSTVLTANLETIENAGGGSARCMMAEIFIPKRD